MLPLGPASETSWLVGGLAYGQTYELTPEPWRAFLERFLEPYRNHTPDWRAYYRGAYGPVHARWLPELTWAAEFDPIAVASAFVPALVAPEPELLAVAKRRPCPRWKAPQSLLVLRYAGERERLTLTDCDGALDTDALDRLSVLARPAGAARPALPLPLEPDGDGGEWTDEVRLLHPRLAWALSEIGKAFPGHALVLMSGYRRDGHSGLHGKGRALDLYVQDVPNEALFAACRRLRDAGCGYYPNNRFVHVDVRPFGTHHVLWVDDSAPGAPSHYVDGWPGVLPPGVAWLGGQ